MCEYNSMRVRMRQPVLNVYERQAARCLRDIEDVYELPDLVIDRIKRAIEYACVDTDKLNKEFRDGKKELQGSVQRPEMAEKTAGDFRGQ